VNVQIIKYVVVSGVNCSIDVVDCIPDDVCNKGTCVDLLNNFTCDCFPGYEGNRCQTEINECTRYQPCKNGAQNRCTDRVNDYFCNCPDFFNGKQYGGKNCTFEFTACKSSPCLNGARCSNVLIDEAASLQAFSCECAAGFTGKVCNISSVLSFDHTSNLTGTVDVNPNMNTLHFTFRTTLKNVLLIAHKGNNSRGYSFVLELSDGQLSLNYENGSAFGTLRDSTKVNDATWYDVLLLYAPSFIIIKVDGARCPLSCSITSTDIQMKPLNKIAFGNTGALSVPISQSSPQFVGCMRDVEINRTEVAVSLVSPTYTLNNVTERCDRNQQCYSNTCSGNGDCEDLWNKFKCHCRRPNLGTICDKSKWGVILKKYKLRKDARKTLF